MSSGTWLPNAGGVASADTMCQSEAAVAGLPGTYLALLATTTATAASRFDRGGAVWVNTAGLALADSADRVFTAGVLNAFLDRFADGTTVPVATWAWSADPDDDHAEGQCGGWTTPVSTATGNKGATWASDHRTMFTGSFDSCDVTGNHLYCFQQ